MTERNLRLISALIVGLFVALHLLNHSLGLLSVDAKDAMRQQITRFWHFLPITIILYLALLTHFVRAFVAMAQALEKTGGHYEQFNGDGLRALYGVEGNYVMACRDALRGALKMQKGLDALNSRLADELPEPLAKQQ